LIWATQQCGERSAVTGRQTGCWLIQQENVRGSGKRHGNFHLTPLSVGNLDRAPAEQGRDTGEFSQPEHLLFVGSSIGAAPQMQAPPPDAAYSDVKVIPHGQLVQQERCLVGAPQS
jgi:hypothetical protein